MTWSIVDAGGDTRILRNGSIVAHMDVWDHLEDAERVSLRDADPDTEAAQFIVDACNTLESLRHSGIEHVTGSSADGSVVAWVKDTVLAGASAEHRAAHPLIDPTTHPGYAEYKRRGPWMNAEALSNVEKDLAEDTHCIR